VVPRAIARFRELWAAPPLVAGRSSPVAGC